MKILIYNIIIGKIFNYKVTYNFMEEYLELLIVMNLQENFINI